MKKLIFSLLVTTMLGVSCQQDDVPTPPPAPVQYMSVKAGSTWNYENTDNIPPAATTTYTLSSTTKDSTINGKPYRVFTSSSGGSSEYFYIAGNEYYTLRMLPPALGGSSVEYVYLKDNAAVGATWAQTYPVTVSGITLNATLTNTITEKGISKTVKGTTYNDVIHITTSVAVTFGGIPLPAGAITADIQAYYAPRVGMIHSINKINLNYAGFTENTDQQTSLVSADIK